MNDIENVEPLPHKHRKYFFRTLFLVFILIVPALIFYATGYRYSFNGDQQPITVVGGMYVSADADDIEIYVDDELSDDVRLFRSASYIQNLLAGMHQVHVQGPEVYTWTKQLPVYSHIVTEAGAFNMPIVPQLRLVSEFQTSAGNAVVLPSKGVSSTTFFAFASSTNQIQFATTTATTSLAVNTEYVFIESLFASSSELAAQIKRDNTTQSQSFNFSSIAGTSTISTSTATTTKLWQDVQLFEVKDEIYATYLGEERNIPYYYCLTYVNASTTAAEYGEHVFLSLQEQLASTTDFTNPDLAGQQLCRDTIRIDRKWQEVQWFDFYPDSTDLVLMLLQDGLYVVEVDDRAWQNTQLLYPGDDLQVVLDGGRIFVQDDGFYFEVFTEVTQ